eukprot:COSAG01_NODE_4202_length_5244_cov_168.024101_6_plen_187_part_00
METCVYADAEERQQLFNYLDALPVEYHKEYKRFNKIVKVPRGQASYTLHNKIHYDYKVSGGSPPNHVMCETPKAITARVNEALGTNFNTILLNKYKNGGDCIGFHRDRETGWVEGTGFATLCFGAERDFQIKDEETSKVRNIPHQDGWVIHMPHPMNQNYLHGVPQRKRVTDCCISLTFREIVANQ